MEQIFIRLLIIGQFIIFIPTSHNENIWCIMKQRKKSGTELGFLTAGSLHQTKIGHKLHQLISVSGCFHQRFVASIEFQMTFIFLSVNI